jgi:ATP-binding cassette subfamily B protein
MAGPKIRPARGPGSGGGPAAAMMPGEKPKNFRGTMSTLGEYLKPYRVKLVLACIAALFSVVFSVVSPFILGMATDVVADSVLTDQSLDFTRLGQLILVLLLLYGVSALFSGWLGFLMAGVAQKISYQLRKDLSEKLDRLPLSYFDHRTHGEILSRVTNDVDTVNTTLNQTLSQIVTNGITILGILALMIYINPLMTLIALLTIPLSLWVIRQIVKRSQGHFKDNQRFLGQVNGHIEEMFSGHIIVKAFNGEKQSKEIFENWNHQLANAGEKSQFLSGTMMPLINMIGNLGFILVCVVGGALALQGRMTIGSIQAFVQYIRTFNHPIAQLANVANVLQSTAAAAERIFEVLKEEEELPDSEKDSPLKAPQVRGEITFDHVSFHYPTQEENPQPLIQDFHFVAKPGQRVAIVGPTGAGKTTIVKLLLRFYELSGGRILVDGVDITTIPRKELRSIFSMVLQDNWLFSGTIEENIGYGSANPTREEIVSAAHSAHIHHFIKTQPGGYHMVIQEEAGNLSQGQKQLMTLARAFLADSPILILDEATSSVDTRTEAQIQKAMAQLMEGRTSFVIAHRLSTIVDADVILVMKNGDVVEKGTHQELLAQGGFYKTLYESQYL